LFLLAQSVANAVAIGLLNTAYVYRRTNAEWLAANAGPIAALCVLWPLQLFVLGLWFFHSWLALTNTTSFETASGAQRLWYLAGTEPRDCDLPFSRGVASNLRLFFCVLDSYGRGLPGGELSERPSAIRAASASAAGGDASPEWEPHAWPAAEVIERDGAVCDNLWENEYWSCC